VLKPALPEEVDLVPLDTKEAAKGYRANALRLRPVLDGESIGTIDDFMFGRDGGVFAMTAVGGFGGVAGHLVAVPFNRLKLDDPSANVILPGASRAALLKLPVFLYNR
jgi:PRC-barrel domain